MSYILSIDFGNRNIKTAVYNPRLVENPNSPEAVREFEKVEPQRNLGDYNGGPSGISPISMPQKPVSALIMLWEYPKLSKTMSNII